MIFDEEHCIVVFHIVLLDSFKKRQHICLRFLNSVGGESNLNVSLAFSSSYISAPGNINLLRICRQHCGYFLANSFSLFFSFESNV